MADPAARRSAARSGRRRIFPRTFLPAVVARRGGRARCGEGGAVTRMIPACWFHDLGVSVFPTIDKAPAIPKGASWKGYGCTREEAARFREYAVVLGVVAVVDSDTPTAEAWNAAHLPATP